MNPNNIQRYINENNIKIIWIEENILRDKYTNYYNEFHKAIHENCPEYKNLIQFKAYDKLDGSINYIITNLKFEATFVIISGTLYYDFFIEFYNNINKIYIIPQIIIFAKNNIINKKEILKNNVLKNNFYKGRVYNSFEKIKKYIIGEIRERKVPNEKVIKFNEQNFDDGLIFEYIEKKEQLLLPMFYKVLIESNPTYSNQQFIVNLYKRIQDNAQNQDEIDALKNLIKSIFTIKDIPTQLLSKYYVRIFTYESNIYKDLNIYLRNNNEPEMSIYLPFIKELYKGVDLKSLPLYSQNEKLYRGSKASIDEIIKIEAHIKKKVKFPTFIVFSRVFLSFSKEEETAKAFLQGNLNDTNLRKVFFVLEKNNNEYSLSSHADIEEISFHRNEKEVLFFPFSAFEIIDIEDAIINNENVKKITLNYLGKYLKEFKKDEQLIAHEIILPDTDFKKNLKESGLVKKEEVTKITNKQILKKYDDYKTEIKNSHPFIKNEGKPLNNIENVEIVSVSDLNKDLAVDLKKRQLKEKVQCTTCKLFTFILFLSMLVRIFIYFTVYIIIRNENNDNDNIYFSFQSKIQNLTFNKRILSKYSGIYYNCIKGQSKFINSKTNTINIGLRWDNNNTSNINDLNLSLDGLDKNNKLIGKINFGKLEGLNSSITFSYDNLRGEGHIDNEAFKIYLDKIPYNISSLAILINSNHKNSLKNIKGGYIRIKEEGTRDEIDHYLLNDIKDGIIFLYGIIERTSQKNKWIFRRIYESFEERNISYNKILLNETIIAKDIK